LGPLLLLALWQGWTVLFGVAPETFPGPTEVVRTGIDLTRSGVLGEHLVVSLGRALRGLAFGSVIGVVLAVLAGTRRQSGEVLDSAMQVVKAVPVFALVPLFIVWMGIGEAPKLTLIAVATALPIYINTYAAIRAVDNDLAEVASVLGLGPWGVVRHVLLPGSIAGFLAGLRLAATGAWLALIFAETVNAMTGLGYLMHQAQNAFRMDIIVLIVTVYAVLGLIGYAAILGLQRVLLSWQPRFKGL
jgi:sulfonate transport system permease protein